MREKLEEESHSSPSREFSFTISLHHHHHHKSPSPPIAAVDLSPADDIFFHGHLLPLHLLSQFPSPSPRSSTNSIDGFTLPIKELLQENQTHPKTSPPQARSDIIADSDQAQRPMSKPKSFSFLRWKTNRENGNDSEEIRGKRKRKIVHILKRYLKMVRPILLSLGDKRKEKLKVRGQPYSFSGNLTSNGHKALSGEIRRRGEISAPASLRTSPNNSGLLVPNDPVSRTSNDSTMEELHAAIQAAIAHCKSSIATEDSKGKMVNV